MKKTTLPAMLMFLFAQSSWAQGEPRVIKEADRTVTRKKAVIDFTDVAVEGELTKPEGAYDIVKNKTYFESMIRIRPNFVTELQKSPDNL